MYNPYAVLQGCVECFVKRYGAKRGIEIVETLISDYRKKYENEIAEENAARESLGENWY